MWPKIEKLVIAAGDSGGLTLKLCLWKDVYDCIQMSENFNTVDIIPDANWLRPLSAQINDLDYYYRDFLTPSNDYGNWNDATPPKIELNLWKWEDGDTFGLYKDTCENSNFLVGEKSTAPY